MRVHVFARNVTVTPLILELIERRLGFALGRFATRVFKVVVRLGDINGPRGGIDQQCRIEAQLMTSARRVAQGQGRSIESAICSAVERIACAVRKDLARRRTSRIRAGRRSEEMALA